jgi:hypothetical protein
MAKRRDWRSVVWRETLADGQTVCRVKLSDSRTPPGHVLFGRRLEQLAGLLKDARKAHEDATHKATLKKTKPLPFAKGRTKPSRVRDCRSGINLDSIHAIGDDGEETTAQAGATETSS